jgi:DNA-binding transcriptional regulator GbsR (MarR family)
MHIPHRKSGIPDVSRWNVNTGATRDGTRRLAPAVRNFVEYFGALGPRWGLDADACRVHAWLYLVGRPVSGQEMAQALGLEEACVSVALVYLADFRMVEQTSPSLWRTGGDPWDMLLSGLEERRRREIGPALDTLRECQRAAVEDSASDPGMSQRISRLLMLVEDLAALDGQARRLSPQFLRGIVGMSGRAARLVDRVFGPRNGGR